MLYLLPEDHQYVVNGNIVGTLGMQSLREIAGFVPRTQPHVGVRKNAL
jgi:hypothetical protein